MKFRIQPETPLLICVAFLTAVLGFSQAQEASAQEIPTQQGPTQAAVVQEASGVAASAGSGIQSPGPLGTDPTASEDVAPEVVIKAFKETAPKEILEDGMAAAKAFDESSEAFRMKVLAMRQQRIQFVNGLNDDRQRYLTLRDESRSLMNETYRNALNLIEFMPHPLAARFVVTVLEQRVNNDIYDRETLEGAAKLLDFGVRLRYVAQAAARSGMIVGDFDLSERIYKSLEEDELEDLDKGLIGQAEEIKKQWKSEQELLKNDPEDLPRVRFRTSRGEFIAELYIDEAPSTVSHFISLVESGFYDGLDFFQVVEGLLALTGDPLGDGSSRPDRFLADEHGRETVRSALRGSLVMAKLPKADNRTFVPNSAGTQFAILYMPFPMISEQQTVFGRVIEGMDVVCAFRKVDPHKEKKKNAILVPPDRIIDCEMINRPDELPEVIYAAPTAPVGPTAPMPR